MTNCDTETRREIHELPGSHEVEVIYTNEASVCDVWIRKSITDRLDDEGTLAVGLDVEWRPNFISKAEGGKPHKTAVLQLSVNESALVFHIFHAKTLPKVLRDMLVSSRVLKAGVGIKEDAKKLENDYGLATRGLKDLGAMASTKGCSQKKFGRSLKKMSLSFLAFDIHKPKTVTLSNWENFPLQSEQVRYAAQDAWLGYQIYEKLARMPTVVRKQSITQRPGSGLGIKDGPAKMEGKGWRANCQFVCPACNKKCKTQSALDKHVATKHMGKRQTSNQETKNGPAEKTGTQGKTDDPTKVCSRETGKCPATKTRQAWRANCQFVCPKCKKKCKTQSDLDKHIAEKHLGTCNVSTQETKNGPATEECTKGTMAGPKSQRVRKGWRATCQFVCPTCKKKCRRQSDLDQHIAEKHLGMCQAKPQGTKNAPAKKAGSHQGAKAGSKSQSKPKEQRATCQFVCPPCKKKILKIQSHLKHIADEQYTMCCSCGTMVNLLVSDDLEILEIQAAGRQLLAYHHIDFIA